MGKEPGIYKKEKSLQIDKYYLCVNQHIYGRLILERQQGNIIPFKHLNVREHRKGVVVSSGFSVFTCIGSNVTYNQFSCGSIFIIQCITILYVVFMLCVCVRGQWYQTGLDYMSKMWVSYKRQTLSTLCEHLGPYRFLMRSVLLIFFRHVSCLPYVAIVSGLSILDCPFGFLYRLL